MKGEIISQDRGAYLVAGEDGKRYHFSSGDWLGKNSPKIGDSIDFVCEGDVIKSVFPLVGKQQLKQSKLVLALVCWFFGWLGAHRFMVGKFGTGILMLVLTFSFLGSPISVMWIIIDFIVIVAGKFTDEDGNQITNW